MKEWIAGIILPFADVMYNLVKSVPMGYVRALVFGILGALAIWVISMPPQLPETDRGKNSLLKDIRFFAIAVLLLQSMLYIIF